MNRLVLIHAQLQRALRDLLTHPQRPVVGHLGVCVRPGGVDLLGRVPGSEPLLAADAQGSAGGQFTLALTEAPEPRLEEWVAQAIATGRWQVWLALGSGTARGHLAAALLTPAGQRRPLHRLLLVGPGMYPLEIGNWGLEIGDWRLEIEDWERWSRTVGALGADAWRRLVTLRYGIVGCGRTGSLLAHDLAALGVRHLVLVDPDRLERHNLGEMVGAREADLGRPKAEALAHGLASAFLWLRAEPVAASVTARRSLQALLSCDVLCCCADRDSARLATAVLAVLYLKPLLDIGTGVLAQRAEARPAMGADVRLILPGEGCVLCRGGVADPEEARRNLLLAWAEATAQSGDWRRERAGSLRSLNQIAVGLALRLWEDLVAERRQEGAWLRLAFDHRGHPALHAFPRQPNPGCPLCRYLGGGDALRSQAVQALLRDQGWNTL